MAGLPTGVSPETLSYLIAFTRAHEGDTAFMYNNWPIKNPRKDVTIGIGRAISDEAEAARFCNMFIVKSSGRVATPEDMRQEFRRVFNTARTDSNLYSAFRDPSPLRMIESEKDKLLIDDLLRFWHQNGVYFPNFATMPAQAQVMLMSWNYGMRLRNAPRMCRYINEGLLVLAAAECQVPGWNERKNNAHKILLENAATIDSGGRDRNKLPPVAGPFKPPPIEW